MLLLHVYILLMLLLNNMVYNVLSDNKNCFIKNCYYKIGVELYIFTFLKYIRVGLTLIFDIAV